MSKKVVPAVKLAEVPASHHPVDLESNILQLVDQLLLPGLVYEPGVVGGLGQGGVVTSLQLILIPSDLVLRNLVVEISKKLSYAIISGIEQYK